MLNSVSRRSNPVRCHSKVRFALAVCPHPTPKDKPPVEPDILAQCLQFGQNQSIYSVPIGTPSYARLKNWLERRSTRCSHLPGGSCRIATTRIWTLPEDHLLIVCRLLKEGCADPADRDWQSLERLDGDPLYMQCRHISSNSAGSRPCWGRSFARRRTRSGT